PPPADYAGQTKAPVVVVPKYDAPPAAPKSAPRVTAKTPEPFATPSDLRASAMAPEPFSARKDRPIPKEPEPIIGFPTPANLPVTASTVPLPRPREPLAGPALGPHDAGPEPRKTRERILDGADLESPIALELDMAERPLPQLG